MVLHLFRCVVAPGRVNLIGEHTDYNDGFVLPLAIERGLKLTVRAREDRQAMLSSTHEPETLAFDLREQLVPGERDGAVMCRACSLGFNGGSVGRSQGSKPALKRTFRQAVA